MERANSGTFSVDEYRAALPPLNAPNAEVAGKVWRLVEHHLPRIPTAKGGSRERRFDDVASSVRRWLSPAECVGADITAMQALAVAVETAIRSARAEKTFFANDVFEALASRWSPTWRSTPGRTVWGGEKLRDTIIQARREMLVAGVDFARIWTAVANGIDGLYTVKLLGGAGHARGKKVALTRGPKLRAYERLVPPSNGPRNRILLADAPAPELKIASTVVAEREYDRMEIGDQTRHVINALESTRLFLVVNEVLADVQRLTAQEKAHPWPGMLKAWRRSMQNVKKSSPDYRAAYKAFVKQHRLVRAEYNSIASRLAQARAVEKQITRHEDRVDHNGHIEIKTGYYKTRSRRFQPRHLWPSEISSKEDAEQVVVPAAEVLGGDAENEEYTFVTEDEARRIEKVFEGVEGVERIGSRVVFIRRRPDVFTVPASPRGRWFKVRAHEPEVYHIYTITGKEWYDEFTGPYRPLKGVDASGSMFSITACLLGWRDVERMCLENDFKLLIAEGILKLSADKSIPRINGNIKQIRRSAGEIWNCVYGAALGRVLAKLRDDPTKYGTGWTNLGALLKKGREISEAIDVVVRMRDEYKAAANRLVDAAQILDVDGYSGLTVLDPFDGTLVRWHRPRVVPYILNNGGLPLVSAAPVGKPNAAGDYPANYQGDPAGGRDARTGCISNLAVPGMIHMLDAAFLSHVVLLLRERGVRDIVVVHDCFLVPSDAYPILKETLDDAVVPWFAGLGTMLDNFQKVLVADEVIARWRAAWNTRMQDCEAGRDSWPLFRFKDEVTLG